MIKVYTADDVNISNVDLSCGSGAIQVNSSSVTIAGDINMHDNMYDGIEVTTGKDLNKKGTLKLADDVTFTNENSRIWMDSKDKGTVTSSGQIAQTVNPTKTSEYLYLTKEPAVQVGDNYYLTLNDAVHYASDNTCLLYTSRCV